MKISSNRIEQQPWITSGILKTLQRLQNAIKTLQVTCTDAIRLYRPMTPIINNQTEQ